MVRTWTRSRRRSGHASSRGASVDASLVRRPIRISESSLPTSKKSPRRVAAAFEGARRSPALRRVRPRARHETQIRAGATRSRATVPDSRRTDVRRRSGRKSGRPPRCDDARIEGVGAGRTSATRAGDADRRSRSGGSHGVGHDSRHVLSVRASVVLASSRWRRKRRRQQTCQSENGLEPLNHQARRRERREQI